MAKSKEVTNLIKQAECQGWQVESTRKGHYKWVSPLGKFFFSSSTPSDHRALDNLKRDLRVNGFVFIERRKGRKK